MAVIFISPEKRKRQLAAFLIAITGLLLVLVIWRVFLIKPPDIPRYEEIYKFPEIQIDFEFLDSEKIEALRFPEKIILTDKDKVGRDNPFVMYLTDEALPPEDIIFLEEIEHLELPEGEELEFLRELELF